MTTTIAAISRQEVNDLLSEFDGGRLTVKELEVFRGFVLSSSKIRMGCVDGKLLCIWGLIPPTLLSDQAYLWLHTTPEAEQHQFILVRRSQIEMTEMKAEFAQIIGHCEVDEALSIRWLKWLGAQFGEPHGKLIPFVIRGTDG